MPDALPGRSGIELQFAQISEVGDRQSNQDALGHARQDDLSCFVVADGVGGREGGDIAATIVIESVLDSFLQDSSFSNRALRSYLDFAVVQVAVRKDEEQGLENMSATVAALLIDQKNRCAYWGHMGDTRVYLFRAGKMHGVTRDHSVVQQFIDAGYNTPDQLRTHPQRNALFAAIGAEGESVPEVIPAPVELLDGDAFLICTDGLWEWIEEAQMESILAASGDAQQWLQALCAAAADNSSASPKSRDNFTAFAIRLACPDTAAQARPLQNT